MNQKVTLAVSAALMSMSMHAAAEFSDAVGPDKFAELKSVAPVSINKAHLVKRNQARFVEEKGLENKQYIYIVHLQDDAVAMYDGGIEGLEATNPHTRVLSTPNRFALSKKDLKLDTQAPAVKAYVSHLASKHTSFLNAAQSVSSSIESVATYKYALNGMAVKATPAEAKAMSKLPGVRYIERDQLYTLDTDQGPSLVGAPQVWDGSANAGVSATGEGMVVGIVDSGINTGHPSFADIGGDGYDHTNPLGAGNYLGDCAGEFPELCNDKLIGVYSYPVITDNYDDTTVFPVDLPKNGEDYGGHGTHVAGTVAGNILYDVEERAPVAAEESPGEPTGFVFDRISGVAPHANIISYQVCFGGRSSAGDTYGDCPGAAIAAGIESALQDGVDVINYSISGGGFPWNSSTEMAYLAARNAGIFVATSAGNGGPGAATTPKHAPWYTAVAAAEHGRAFDYDKEIGEFSGGDTTIDPISGVSNSGSITASIVYAGNFTNANDPDGDPAQCLQPFPEGTFSGEIVVCDRGSIARVDKAVNAAAGGAGGLVLANIQGGAATLNADRYVIPGIHISADSGDILKTWLASGEGHSGTITEGSGELVIDEDRVDVLAGFSSKGPNTSISTLTPTVTGPGVQIYAAYADQQFGHDGHQPFASDYDYLSGTSMSSPHIAGAAALVKSARPAWTPDNLRSALAMTAEITVKKEDGVTAGDWFDMGSGRIRADLAINAGLIMDETAQNYEDANPNEGGEPRSLNLPSVTDNQCVGTCSWTRTVTATTDGTWAVDTGSISPGLVITATPATFTLAAGESQEIEVSIDAFGAESDVWSFGIVRLTSDVSPDLHMPVSVVASKGNLPASFDIDAARNQDSLLVSDLLAVEITDLQSASMVVKGTVVEDEVLVDSDNSAILDDLTDGLSITGVTVPEGAMRMVAEITETTSPDLDLWVVFDANADGVPTEDEIVASSATASSFERVDVMAPDAGFYWIIVQNWASSGEGVADSYALSYGTVADGSTDLVTIDAPSAIPQLTSFDIRFAYDLDGAATGDRYYGVVSMGTDAENATNLGVFPMDIVRGADDVTVETSMTGRVETGDPIDYSVSVLANFSSEDRDYEITMAVPDGFEMVGASLGENATYDAETSTVTWTLMQPSLLGASPTYRITSNETDELCLNPNFGPNNFGYIDLAAFGVAPQPFDGDTVSGTFNVNAFFLGTLYNSVTVTDDGFVTVGLTDVGSSPWVNQIMPDEAAPNAVLAPFWRDLIFDVDNGSFASFATAGAGTTIVEWDNMRFPSELYGAAPSDDLIDIQLTFINAPAPNQPNIVFAYDNVTHDAGMGLPISIGYEDATGTVGATAYHSSAAGTIGDITTDIVDGRLICMYLEPIPSEPTLLPFSLVATDAFVGGPVQVMVTSDVVNSDFTSVVASEVEASIQVEGAPIATINGEMMASLEVIELRDLALPGAVTEPNGDSFDILWRQTSGPAALIKGNGLADAILEAPEVTEDTMLQLEMEVTDSNGNVGTAYVDVMVMNNQAPSISISAPASVGEGETITISVSGTDPEGDALTYTINGTPGSTFSTTAPGTSADTTVSFTVTASDGLNTTTDSVSVTVTDKSGGSMGWIALLLIPVAFLRRRVKAAA